MIKAFICDTRALDEVSAEKIINETPALAGVITPKSSVRWLESAAAYLLLASALDQLGYSGISAIAKDGCGKPHLLSNRGKVPHISISHRPGVALVVICDSDECGADIEREIDEVRAPGIEKRYLSSMHPIFDKACKCNMSLYVMDRDGNLSFGEKTTENDYKYLHIEKNFAPRSVTERWTLLEAVMKLDGCGVSGMARFDEIFANVATAHFSLWLDGESYSISVAERVNI